MRGLKHLCSLVIISFIMLGFIIPQVEAAEDKQRIYDFADILSAKEIHDLEKVAAKYSKKRETDFIILTTDEGEKDITVFMGDFYDDEGLGYNKEHGNTAIIALDMKNRDVQLAGFAKAREYLADERLDKIRNKITPDLSGGNYKEAFEDFITLSSRYMQFRVGANPANPIYNIWVQLGLSIFIATFIVIILARNPGMKKTVNASTYQDDSRTKLNVKKDRYIRTSVTKKLKPKSNSGSGGSGGGSSGGGFTGGGRSFSGSRGKF